MENQTVLFIGPVGRNWIRLIENYKTRIDHKSSSRRDLLYTHGLYYTYVVYKYIYLYTDMQSTKVRHSRVLFRVKIIRTDARAQVYILENQNNI